MGLQQHTVVYILLNAMNCFFVFLHCTNRVDLNDIEVTSNGIIIKSIVQQNTQSVCVCVCACVCVRRCVCVCVCVCVRACVCMCCGLTCTILTPFYAKKVQHSNLIVQAASSWY